MASRLNLLFQVSPKSYLERTVLFTDQLTSSESTALLSNKQVHCIDLAPLGTRSTARVLPNVNAYSDTPLTSHFVPPGSFALVPKDDLACRYVFLPEFVGCRLLVSNESDTWLRLECERGLAGSLPAAEGAPGSRFLDSFAYWDYTRGHLVGRIRATAVLVKHHGEPWTIYMQQIVGTPGFECVRELHSRRLKY